MTELFRAEVTCSTVVYLECHAPLEMGLPELPDDPVILADLRDNNGINCEGGLVPGLHCMGCRFLREEAPDIEEDNRIVPVSQSGCPTDEEE